MAPFLIEYGENTPDAAQMRRYYQYWEDYLPFEGVVIPVSPNRYAGRYGMFTNSQIRQNDWSICASVFHNRIVPRADYTVAIRDLSNTRFSRFRHNLLPLMVDNVDFMSGAGIPFDWFDNAWWNNVLLNIQSLAYIAREGGCEGIFFDTEQYVHVDGADPRKRDLWSFLRLGGGRSFQMLSDQLFARGKDFMQAIDNTFPGCHLLLAHGSSTIDQQVNRRHPHEPTEPYTTHLDADYALLAPFIDGMLKAAHDKSYVRRITDGCEITYLVKPPSLNKIYRSQADFAFMRQVVFHNSREYSRDKDFYTDRVLAAAAIFGIEDGNRDLDAIQMREAVCSAMLHSDRYTWMWNQHRTYWLQPNRVTLPADHAHAKHWKTGVPPAASPDNFLREDSEPVGQEYLQAIRDGMPKRTSKAALRIKLQVDDQDSQHLQSVAFIALRGFSGHVHVWGPGGSQQAIVALGVDGNGRIAHAEASFHGPIQKSIDMGGGFDIFEEPNPVPNSPLIYWRFKNIKRMDGHPPPTVMTVEFVGCFADS